MYMKYSRKFGKYLIDMFYKYISHSITLPGGEFRSRELVLSFKKYSRNI